MDGVTNNRYCCIDKPTFYMIVLQIISAGFSPLSKAGLLQGMSPRVFVVYRQLAATLITAPFACYSRWRDPLRVPLGLKGFSLIFVTSLLVTAAVNAFAEGLYLSSSAIAAAMTDLVPATTFVIAAILGLEKVDLRSLRSIAKIIGTVLCVGGGFCMALVKGPKLFDPESFLSSNSILKTSTSSTRAENLQLGCFYLFLSCVCWSFWKIPVSATCPDHLYSTLWLCFFSTIQSAIFTLLIEHNPQVWHLGSFLELGSCFYAAFTTTATFFIVSWCISQRGPVFTAIFNPLCTVITAIFSTSLLHENLYIGSLIGALAVIVGLYAVLWGKAKDIEERGQTR